MIKHVNKTLEDEFSNHVELEVGIKVNVLWQNVYVTGCRAAKRGEIGAIQWLVTV